MTLPWQRGFSGGERKKRERYWRERYVLKGERWVTEDRAYDCGCNSGSPLRDAVGSKNRTHPPLERILPEPGQPSARLSKLIRLTACKKAIHATSRWYRTVYIPWLVDICHLPHSVPAQNTRPISSSPQHHRAIFEHSHPLPSHPLPAHLSSLALPISKTSFRHPRNFPQSLSPSPICHSFRNFNCPLHNHSLCPVPAIG